MVEYIEKQSAIDLFYMVDPENDGSDGCTVVYKQGKYSSDEIEAMLSELPTADVAPVHHAHVVVNWLGDCHCSSCGENVDCTRPFCAGCGARLDEPEQRE